MLHLRADAADIVLELFDYDDANVTVISEPGFKV